MSSAGAGVGGFLSDTFGGTNQYNSNAQAADQSYYQLPNMQQNQSLLQSMYARNGQAPMANAAGFAGPNIAQDQQAAAQQQQLAGTLMRTAQGVGPSVASLQLQQGLQQQLAQQRAQAASAGTGVNPFLMQRQLANNTAQAYQATNAQMAQQRAQEVLNAQNSLGGVLQGIRGQGQDMQQMQLGAAAQNAQLQQQAALANQSAGLQQQQINNQNQQFAAQGLMGLSAQQLQANQNYAQSLNDMTQFNGNINANIAQQNAAAAQRYGGAILGGLSSGLASMF